jgi:hypothetical protein
VATVRGAGNAIDVGGVVGFIEDGSTITRGSPVEGGPESVLPWGIGAAAASVRSRRKAVGRMAKIMVVRIDGEIPVVKRHR